MEWICIVFSWFFLSMLVGFIAKNKAIGSNLAIFISLFFSPLIGLLFVIASDPINGTASNEKQRGTRQPRNNNSEVGKVDAIKKLAELLDNGHISQAEFDEQKKKLLKS